MKRMTPELAPPLKISPPHQRSSPTTLNSMVKILYLLLLSNPSDLNQIKSMRSFAFTISNKKSGRLRRSSQHSQVDVAEWPQ
ncbi:hypothetical protein AVEN_186311-1 [Araneus ventricosus]|uniref:Uncharacterized protein n=1 Tax=Araneus ventricosus TaxID=182803 RepID=A0A4Y2UVF5_ARAVE|nr:hypothetical protein AVEN_232565-1 [Araneus ventricosus]GBO16969.1 hypothetical protein AVEN_176912-1 [Araneus ventricosus]GBO18518.1 hypothetical protein AVEN_134746-1 [Araneus ventricosus]GBO18519.1 hypothetical protein AVEN_186311-1 [Araneus ventricosus]